MKELLKNPELAKLGRLIGACKVSGKTIAQWCETNNKELSRDLFTQCHICHKIVFIGSTSCPHCKALGRVTDTGKGCAPFKYQERGVKKVGRNESCPCGSDKKFKKCHGRSK